MNFRLLLLPFSWIFALLTGIRNLLYDKGILPGRRFHVPVILVGNLSVGGTGKTPHVEYLAELLRKPYRVATLSRGYGRETTGFVMAGKGSSARQLGDEPMQYHSKFDDITVAVCEDRVEGIGRLMAEAKPPEVVIMDDGYQHRRVTPGFSILLTAADRLFTRDYVLPAGDLREPRSGYRRASCIIVTKSRDTMTGAEKRSILEEIAPLPDQPVFFSSLEYTGLQHFFSAETLPVESLKSRRVLLFSGIADPSHLESFAGGRCAGFEAVRFPDHHAFQQKDVDLIIRKFSRFAGDSSMILTTEKDYHRLRHTGLFDTLMNLPCYYIPIRIKLDSPTEFHKLILGYVEQNKRNS